MPVCFNVKGIPDNPPSLEGPLLISPFSPFPPIFLNVTSRLIKLANMLLFYSGNTFFTIIFGESMINSQKTIVLKVICEIFDVMSGNLQNRG